jgi:hypothetical protein
MNLAKIAAAVTLAIFSSGCGGSSKEQPSATSAAPAAAADKPGVLGWCLGKGLCDEFRGSVPATAESACTKRAGTFSRGATGCPTNDRLVGTCGESKVMPETTSYWYGDADSAHDDQAVCESKLVGGKWTPKGH